MMNGRPIKVLHFNSARGWRGGEQQVLYLVRGLKQYPVIQYAAGQRHEKFLQEIAGHVSECFPLRASAEFRPSTVFELVRLIKKNEIDIVHTHSTPAHSLSLQAKFFHGNFKLVVHRRVDFKIKNNFLSKFKYKTAKVDKIIAISRFIKDLLINQGVPQEKIEVIHSGVDPLRFKRGEKSESDLRAKYGLSPHEIILGNIAALTGHKDHLTLIRSLQQLEESGIDYKLFILGEGSERNNIEEEISRLHLDRRVVMAGFRPDLQNFLPHFDILVHSSQDEGLGTSIIDALANAIPVVATDAGGIPEILGDNLYGLVAPRKNPAALGKAIIKMISDEQLRTRYKNSGPTRAAEFSADEMVKNVFSLYENIIS